MVFEPLLCQKKVAVLPCVWNAASWRTVTGLAVLARTQYGERISSPLALSRPFWLSGWPGEVIWVP